ncbi:metal-dependent transcriptional regulator [Stygiolobus caldivivus]|uniref:DtxR family transcriptional regulator n=1 Tax=Stygiolobus caldivivus TaxID=2824673 RepID=A0A8D5ZI61_9CREN|nr:metal-dependent transcriptional regulator [Stygiolobus caldivivus]BCU69165.1 DtxR family transcriptional regulator [Stygiolobus caldivivus]
MEKGELSEPLENYLKEIYELEEMKGYARVSELITIFQISPGTISKALNRLEKLGLITKKDKKIHLSEEGKKIAERLIKSHRLSERLLTDILGLDWIRAHQIAHRLEHVWPDDVLEKLDLVLNRPKTCPHGHPIPGREAVKGEPLLSTQVGEEIEVIMIVKEEEWILAKASEIGLYPGNRFRVVEKKDSGDIVIEDKNGKRFEIPKVIAEQVLVDGRAHRT